MSSNITIEQLQGVIEELIEVFTLNIPGGADEGNLPDVDPCVMACLTVMIKDIFCFVMALLGDSVCHIARVYLELY